ncbi:hypothetical protein PYCC9005_000118 [Savitreella phatthalungensis]
MSQADPLRNSLFTTSGALIDSVDKKMMLVLRDNTTLFGVLRSFDQFGNLVLQDSYERIYVDDCYADIPKGLFLIRGENLVMMGEIDLDDEDDIPQTKISHEKALTALADRSNAKLKDNATKNSVMHKLGFAAELDDRQDLYLLH